MTKKSISGLMNEVSDGQGVPCHTHDVEEA